jgi:hypothetical protein
MDKDIRRWAESHSVGIADTGTTEKEGEKRLVSSTDSPSFADNTSNPNRGVSCQGKMGICLRRFRAA